MAIATSAQPITKSFESLVQDGPVGPDEVISLITCDNVDRDREVVIPSGIDLTNYRRNPIVNWGHARGLPVEGEQGLPIGTNLWIKPSSDGRGLVAKTKFDIEDPFAARVCGKAKRGVLRSWSITFIPKSSGPPTREEIRKRPDWADAKTIYREVELVEYSQVSAPALADAITIAKERKAMSDKKDEIEEEPKAKSETDESAAHYKAMCDAAKKCFGGMKYPKAALHAHADKMELHHEAGDDEHDKAAIKAEYKDCPHCKAVHVGKDGPSGDGYEKIHESKSKGKDDAAEDDEGGAVSDSLAKAKRDDEDESTEGDGDGSPDSYATLVDDFKSLAKSIKHSGKAGHLYADKSSMKGHWHGHDDDYDDDEDNDYHSRSEIREMLGKAKGCAGMVVSTRKPEGKDWEHIHGDKDKLAKAMNVTLTGDVGALGGFAGEAENIDDASDEAEEIDGIRRYSYVKCFGGSHHKAVGRVHSMHTKGIVPNVDNDAVASKDNPHARVQLYKAYGDGHTPTSIHIAHPVSKMERIDDLKAPSKKPAKPEARDVVTKPTEQVGEKKAVATAAKSPLTDADVLNAHVWALARSGRLDEMINQATENAMAHVLGRG